MNQHHSSPIEPQVSAQHHDSLTKISEQAGTNQAEELHFPSIGEIFSKSWQRFSQNFISLILIVAAVSILSSLSANLILPTITTMSFVADGGTIDQLSQSAPSLALITLIAMICLFIFVLAFFWTMYSVLINIILNNRHQKPLTDLFLQSFHLTLPVLITTALAGFLVLGMSGFVIVPGALLWLLFIFNQQEVIFGKTRYLRALQITMTIFLRHRGAVFFNLLILSLLFVSVGYVIELIAEAFVPDGLIVATASAISFLDLLSMTFATAFFITLYQAARKRTDLTKLYTMKWVIAFSIIGYIILGLLVYWLTTLDWAAFREILETQNFEN